MATTSAATAGWACTRTPPDSLVVRRTRRSPRLRPRGLDLPAPHRSLPLPGCATSSSWGTYIFTFAFFIGLSAGGLIMASSAEVFGIKALKPLSRLGVLSAAACVAVAGLMIIPDLGRPDRIINIFIHPNWSSPLIWDILIISVYFAFSVADLYVLQRHAAEPARWKKVLRVLAYVGLPTAILLHSVTAWISDSKSPGRGGTPR